MNTIANIRRLVFALIVVAFFLTPEPVRLPVLIILICLFLILLIRGPQPSAEANQQRTLQRAKPRAPFGPLQLYLSGVVFSVYGSAIMAGLNWRRMNRSDNNPTTAIMALVFVVLSALLLALLMYSSRVDTPLLPPVAGAIGGVLFAGVMVRWQRECYREWIEAHGGTEPTFADRGGWSIMVIVLVTSFALQFLYGVTIGPAIAERFVVPLTVSVRSSQVFEDSGLQMEYPGQWLSFDAETDMRDLCAEVDCILGLQHYTGQATVVVMRSSNFFDRLTPLETLADAAWSNLQDNAAVTRVSKMVNIAVSGQTAIWWDTYFSPPEGKFKRRTVFTKQPDGSAIMLLADLPMTGSKPYEDDIATMLKRMIFK